MPVGVPDRCQFVRDYCPVRGRTGRSRVGVSYRSRSHVIRSTLTDTGKFVQPQHCPAVLQAWPEPTGGSDRGSWGFLGGGLFYTAKKDGNPRTKPPTRRPAANASRISGEEFDDRLEFDSAVVSVQGSALVAPVLEELLALGRTRFMCSIPVWAVPSGPFTERPDHAGSARSRTQLMDARSGWIEAAPAVTAVFRWRGRCKVKALCVVVATRATHGRNGSSANICSEHAHSMPTGLG